MRISNLLAGALAALALSSAPAAAQGRWRVAYPEAQDPMYAVMQQTFAQQDLLAAMVEPLNEYFPVSRNVTVELAECGRAGAFYDASRPAVQMCYELLVELAATMMGDDGDDGLFVGAFAFILLHQVGHAFVDLMDLPIQGSPEEAADQLAAVMVGNGGGRRAGDGRGGGDGARRAGGGLGEPGLRAVRARRAPPAQPALPAVRRQPGRTRVAGGGWTAHRRAGGTCEQTSRRWARSGSRCWRTHVQD